MVCLDFDSTSFLTSKLILFPMPLKSMLFIRQKYKVYEWFNSGHIGALWRYSVMLSLVLAGWLTGSGYLLQVKTEIEFAWLKLLSILKRIKYYNFFCETKNWDIKWPHNYLWLFLSPSHPWTNSITFPHFLYFGLFSEQRKPYFCCIWVSEFWNCSLSVSFKFVTPHNVFLAEIEKG